ncbi:MAG: hypothetical protein CMJ20_10540 [Phycisphaeraceae bacterium]|nr:hypothetical protein [Phycisphaeraceae bacterium]
MTYRKNGILCAFVIILALLAFQFAGCSPAPSIQTVDKVLGPGFMEPAVGTSIARWPADATRLEADIERAISDLHWAKLQAQHEHPPIPNGVTTHENTKSPVIRVRGMLPDGRSVSVIGWQSGVDEVCVAVHVGFFGDHIWQHRFIHLLARRLAGKPKVQRNDLFELP